MLHFAFLALLIKLETFYLCSANLCSAFRELRDDEDFVDVTLAWDDERIQAHKVILSACGPFFRNVLRRNLHQNPLLYQKGVKYSDLQSVLKLHVSWRGQCGPGRTQPIHGVEDDAHDRRTG